MAILCDRVRCGGFSRLERIAQARVNQLKETDAGCNAIGLGNHAICGTPVPGRSREGLCTGG